MANGRTVEGNKTHQHSREGHIKTELICFLGIAPISPPPQKKNAEIPPLLPIPREARKTVREIYFRAFFVWVFDIGFGAALCLPWDRRRGLGPRLRLRKHDLRRLEELRWWLRHRQDAGLQLRAAPSHGHRGHLRRWLRGRRSRHLG